MNHQSMKRRTKLAQALLLAILVAGTVHVTDSVVGGTLFSDPMQVTVRLAEAGGLHKGSTVNYRGQRIGKVTDVGLVDHGVEATLAIDEGTEVPRDSEFLVRNLSAVGEQYVDIRPRVRHGPVLADGDTVARGETGTPLPIHRVVADAQRLLRRIDPRDIETITHETEAVFGDGQVDLAQTLHELERTRDLLVAIQPDVATLVHRGRIPLRAGVDHADDLRTSARALSQVAAELHRADGDLETLLARGASTLRLVRSLWTAVAPVIGQILIMARPVMSMSEAHLPGLHHWLDWGPSQMAGMAGATRNGSGHVALVPKSLANCVYTDDPSGPFEARRRPPELGRHCTSDDPRVQQRGARNVPRP